MYQQDYRKKNTSKRDPDFTSGKQMTAVMEAEFRTVAENKRNQDEAKQNVSQVSMVENGSSITKQGISFENILYMVANLRRYTNNTKESNEYIIQSILNLSTGTIKDNLFHLGGKAS